MSISYPLSLPEVKSKVITLGIDFNSAISSNPYTFEQDIQEHSGDRWKLTVSLPPMARADAAKWFAFLLSLKGILGTFTAGDPLAASPLGSALGTPLVNGSNAAGSNTLNTKGWDVSETGVLKKGDYIQIGTHLHFVLNDVDSDGSGEATIDIVPRLRETKADDTVIVTEDTQAVFRLDDNSVTYTAGEDKYYQITFSAFEAL